jgi:hypothetical protein
LPQEATTSKKIMKIQMSLINADNSCWRRFAGAIMLCVGLVSAASAANLNPGILPINSAPNGKSYGAWSAAWWQWALSIPETQNPVTDSTGAFAAVGQSGPVWFLGGTFGNSVTRTVTVPAGKALFFPVHNWLFGASVFDCEPSVPGVTCDVPTLREKAAAAATSVQILEASIDGVPVNNIRDHRAISPDAFSVTFPEGAVFGFPAGTFSPHVADGYWLMLAAPTPGQHTIRVRALSPDYGVDNEVIYILTVK